MMKAPVVYRLYGLACASPLRLPCPRLPRGTRADVSLVRGDASDFAAAGAPRRGRPDWFRARRLPDGSIYVCWTGLFEFLVSANGRRIHYRALPGATAESFQNYLLTHVLSFALLAQGREHLHGTTVVIDGAAVAILGRPGHGKSTLGAALLRRGFPLLTDDLVALKPVGRGYRVHAGVPRIKLFPAMARDLLGAERGAPMVRGTTKRILPLRAPWVARADAPLAAIYVLAAPRRPTRQVTLRTRRPREAMLDLVAHTFNTVVGGADRWRQQFAFAGDVARRVPVVRVSYPRRRLLLPAVCEAIVRDVRRRREAPPRT